VADDAAVIQVTRVISIQSQARGVIEMTTTEHYDIILGAVCQAVCRPAAYDTLPGMRGDPLLNERTKVVQGLTHVVD
jgi:hypothetical protein